MRLAVGDLLFLLSFLLLPSSLQIASDGGGTPSAAYDFGIFAVDDDGIFGTDGTESWLGAMVTLANDTQLPTTTSNASVDSSVSTTTTPASLNVTATHSAFSSWNTTSSSSEETETPSGTDDNAPAFPSSSPEPLESNFPLVTEPAKKLSQFERSVTPNASSTSSTASPDPEEWYKSEGTVIGIVGGFVGTCVIVLVIATIVLCCRHRRRKRRRPRSVGSTNSNRDQGGRTTPVSSKSQPEASTPKSPYIPDSGPEMAETPEAMEAKPMRAVEEGMAPHAHHHHRFHTSSAKTHKKGKIPVRAMGSAKKTSTLQTDTEWTESVKLSASVRRKRTDPRFPQLVPGTIEFMAAQAGDPPSERRNRSGTVDDPVLADQLQMHRA